MKKIVRIVLIGLMAVMAVVLMSGCAVKPKVVKIDIMSRPVRPISVYIASLEIFEDSQTTGLWLTAPIAAFTGPIGAVAIGAGMLADQKAAESKFFVKPTNDKEFRDEISAFYAKEFKAEMEKNGFAVVEETNDSLLVIKAKIGIMSAVPMRGMGQVAMEVEIYQQDILIGRLQTNSFDFARWDPKPNLKDLLKEVAKELKNNFL